MAAGSFFSEISGKIPVEQGDYFFTVLVQTMKLPIAEKNAQQAEKMVYLQWAKDSGLGAKKFTEKTNGTVENNICR